MKVNKAHYVIPILACMLLTASCEGGSQLFTPDQPNLVDPALNLSKNDYNNFTSPPPPPIPEPSDVLAPVPNLKVRSTPTNIIEPPIPDIAEILAAPKPPKLGETKLVSVAVTDDVSLKDVLIEMARLAEVDIEVDAGITGGISFRAKDRPFNEVIDRIASLAGLRYTMKNNVLRIERDTPYIQIYSLDFLNIDRSSQNSVSISTNVLSSSGGGGGGGGGGGASGGGGGGSSGGGGGGLNTGSSTSVTSKTDSDFWKQFEGGIKQILSYNESKRMSSSTVSDQAGAGKSGGGKDNAAASTSTSSSSSKDEAFYILNRQGSTMTVSATEGQHALIKEFLRRIQAASSSQVLIEAKIVEVTLDDEYQSGINWSQFGSKNLNFSGNFPSPAATINSASGNFTLGTAPQVSGSTTIPGSPLAFGANVDLSAAVKLAESFGTTRTLSSPRLHATNNQEAVLTFAQNFVYFELSVQQTQSASTTASTTTTSGLNTVTVNSTLHTVPIGIIMALQPSINMDTHEVTLSVRPTLSRITGTVSDPAVAYIVSQVPGLSITNAVPVVEVRELDSVLKLKSGQVMVIGGLMQDIADNTDNGVPGASDVPLFGNLFKGVDKSHSMQELVIFIRATIVDTNGNAAPADKTLYEKYTKDPRPLDFQ